MGRRGRVELKRMENKLSRNVSFLKRGPGLMKKAHEISILCDAQVALIIFSSQGKLFHYSSHHSCMENILERYESNCSAERQPEPHLINDQGSCNLEDAKLKSRLDVLQRDHRHLMGEDLDSLSLIELQSLETQMDSVLMDIRSKKNELMFESILEVQKKNKALQEQNNLLAKEIKKKENEEKARDMIALQWRKPTDKSTAVLMAPWMINHACGYL